MGAIPAATTECYSGALDMINNSSILPECYSIIRGYCQRATESLESLPQCAARDSLLVMADYIWERSN